jgi:GntR family transcriptional regulator
MIDPTADRPVYKQLADILRDRIDAGDFLGGEMLPSAAALARTYVVGTDTVRRALSVVRLEGLIDTSPKVGSFVRERPKATTIRLGRGRVTARMPGHDERRRLDLPEGVPLLVIEIGGQIELMAADRTVIEIRAN